MICHPSDPHRHCGLHDNLARRLAGAGALREIPQGCKAGAKKARMRYRHDVCRVLVEPGGGLPAVEDQHGKRRRVVVPHRKLLHLRFGHAQACETVDLSILLCGSAITNDGSNADLDREAARPRCTAGFPSICITRASRAESEPICATAGADQLGPPTTFGVDLYEAGPGHRGSCSRTPRCRMSRNPVAARRRHRMHHTAAVGSLLSALQSVVLELGRAAHSPSNQLHHSVHTPVCLCRPH